VKRREFIAGLSGAAAWPVVARAEQPSIPVVTYLQFGQTRGDLTESRNKAFVTGLHEVGFDNGRNVIVELVPVPDLNSIPAAVAAQVQRKVAVVFGAMVVASAAKVATNIIPIVFATIDDPLGAGLVGSYGRPGGNVTGVRMRAGDEPAKLLELLHELLPASAAIGVLIDPDGLTSAADKASIEAAAHQRGLHLLIIPVSNENEFEPAFAGFVQAKVDGVLVNDNRYFDLRRNEITALAAHYKLPAVSLPREFTIAGGLASYGSDFDDALRQAGVYVGRILKGEKAGDLPILQPTKFVLTINLKTAKALGLSVPPNLLARADEVIE
jgi:putative tryptophan/tyrosine transport system substrate-binding protein